jgi:hypothetical protein
VTIDPVEVIKFVGGIGGIFSTLFLIIDRMFRYSPTVSFRPHDNAVRLVIRNAMSESMIVDAITVTPPYLGIASRDGTDALTIIQAAVEARAKGISHESSEFLIVDPLAEQMYRVVRLVDFGKLPQDAKIKIRCQWRSTGRSNYLKRTAMARTTVKDILRLQKESQESASFWNTSR